ncbi:ATPase-AAA-core domain-containing protein [Mycena venus]|uniref:ATPase-AAA-core domain-containing protein n=1 Tax=Mycena venus TaxID=2733690 RepID=A0A8H6YVE6_9AGAR|nr:ATPase-AAA-core domain-containing protein [Mycena venus]
MPTVAAIRLKGIVVCLAAGVSLMNDLHDAFATPFIPAIANTVTSLIVGVQSAIRNKDECIQLMESVYTLIYAIVDLHLKSETPGEPASGDHASHWKIRRVETGLTLLNHVSVMQERMQTMHKELLELISTLSDETESEQSSLIYLGVNDSQNSSGSFSLLPSQPRIFHGRESEMESMVQLLNQNSPRVAILGAGGMGKTSLAKAALHHPDVVQKYELRVFVACDSATNSIDLAALIGALLLFWTIWKQHGSRVNLGGGVEELMSLLSEVPHLALVVTMRGAERPGKVHWTRPFLPPLEPLSKSAARETFFDIADYCHDIDDIDQILGFTDNLPLAVNLIAHLVDYEGCSNVLARWDQEKTTMLSDGHDRKSNLDASISISLSSPRIMSLPGSQELLALLAILPDGISDAELLQASLPIQNPLGCRAALLGTSLAYYDEKKRLKTLAPIREHMLRFHPVPTPLIRCLRQHFFLLLELLSTKMAEGTVNPIISNLGNIHNILRDGLRPEHPDIAETIRFTVLLNRFSRLTGRGRITLMDLASTVFPQLPDHKLEVQYITEQFASHAFCPIKNPESLISRATLHLQHVNDPMVQWKFYFTLAAYHTGHTSNFSKIMDCGNKALELSKPNIEKKATTLNLLAEINYKFGHYSAAQTQAREAQKLATLSANLYEEANASHSEALCLTALGNYKRSIPLLRFAKELMELCGMAGGTDSIVSSTAEVHLLKSEYAQVRGIHMELIDSTPQNNTFSHGFALLNLAEIDVLIGAYDDAGQNLERATSIFQATQHMFLSYCNMIRADLNLRKGNKLVAKQQFRQCLDLAWNQDQQVVSYCLERLADICHWSTADMDQVFTCTVLYLVHADKLKQKLDILKVVRCLGDIFMANGDDGTAHTLFTVALEGFTYMDVHRSRADCMLRLGDLAQKQGHSLVAKGLWKEALPLFKRSSQGRDVEKVEMRLANKALLRPLNTRDKS